MRKTKKEPVTAAQLMAQLEADPEWIAQRATQDTEFRRREAENKRDEAPLVKALLAAGYIVDSVWDLVNTAEPYPAALPVLLEHLQRAYPTAVREGIARALAVREAKFAWPVLMRLFRHEQEERAKDGLAVAIAAMADNEVIEDVIALARDTRNGPSRLLLLSALKRTRDPRGRAALEELAADPELKLEIQHLLRPPRRRKR